MSGINWLDILFIIIFLGMLYRGSHGRVGLQSFSVIWWIFLVYCSIGFYPLIASSLYGFLPQSWGKPLGFFTIIFAMSLAVKITGKILSIVFGRGEPEKPSMTKRVGGVVFAGLRTVLVCGVIGIQLMLIPVDALQKGVTTGSRTAMMFVEIDADIFSWIADKLGMSNKEAGESNRRIIT